MKTIDNVSLVTVCGGAPRGIVSPCFAMRDTKLVGASQDQIAQAVASCGVKLPTKRQLRDARNRVF